MTNETLLVKVKQIEALLSHFTRALTSPLSSSDPNLPPADAPDALKALRDAAKLLHAHATKIGLLLINDPFTPSAVQKELTACESQCLPGMMAAVEVCHPAIWTTTVAKEVRLRTEAAMAALGVLLVDVKTKVEGGSVKVNQVKQKEKTLASTGQVWQACDTLVLLGGQSLGGIIANKAEEYRAMLKDAIEELKEWAEDEDDQDEGFVGSDDDEGDKDSIEDMFSGSRLPAHRKDLKELLDHALQKLKLVDMLFQALIKRRVKAFRMEKQPSSAEDREQVKLLEDLVVSLKKISESVDEFANVLYELNADQASTQLGRVLEQAEGVARRMERSWSSTDDEFTIWSKKWQEAMRKPAEQVKARNS